jgi:GNAT superfamily N-acetyltransferase
VLATVTAAFAQDPAWAFLTDGRYAQLAPALAGALFDSRVDTGNVWVADDLLAVAMWDAPDRSEQEVGRATAVWQGYRVATDSRAWEQVRAYNAALAVAAGASGHWYLGTLATHPTCWREGRATAMIEPVLERADAEALACCLETSTEVNRRFYERRGFTDVTAVEVAAGPPTWWLRRAPS